MPKISGREIISESTEKSFRALVLLSASAILTKAYSVPLDELNLLGANLPQSLIDVSLLVAVFFLLYTYVLKWIGDLSAFRLWYQESSIWTSYGTDMKLDKTFIDGGIQLLRDLHSERETGQTSYENLSTDAKKRFDEFEENVKLYAVRLDAAGKKFSMLSIFGHFFVWVQHFIFPVGLALLAIYLILKYGTFMPPIQI